MNVSTMQARDSHASADDIQDGPVLLSASTITGDDVYNMQDEELGRIQDVMLDIKDGNIRYVVLASGGFLGLGDRLFAVPWKALRHDKINKRFTLDVDVERLKNAPGFDKDQWPNMADATWNATVESFYTR
ncbi:MAG: PRC-barrel domain-containing protein [Halomonas sp.]|uniref:PRC-barrel domain-containing protein n=1 Tax=Halomonas sp. TaxID=1486246 RepID=UPI003970DE4F